LRAARIQKKREIELEDQEIRKKRLTESLKVSAIENNFVAHYDAVEQVIKNETVGLVTIDQMKQTQERAILEREKALAKKEKDLRRAERDKIKAKEAKKEKDRNKVKALSFNLDEDEEDEDNDECDNSAENKSPEIIQKKRFGMNPDVDTSFLPDRDRDEEENRMREKLRLQWEEMQRKIKEEEVDITYSYWDGSGHRKSIGMKKGASIYQFLCKVLDNIRGEFPELKTVTGDQLMFVKEDLIIPQTNTFYDFLVTKARGKTGPLFEFDVREDVRLTHDPTIEKDESHAGKVILRSWYERNKHIFPASRWEPYDPTKTYSSVVVDPHRQDFTVPGAGGEGGEAELPLLDKLAKGLTQGSMGIRGACKCSKSTVCEMHYQAKKY